MAKFIIQPGHSIHDGRKALGEGEAIELTDADAELLTASGAVAPAEEAPKAKGKGKAAQADTAAEPAAE